MDFLRRAIAGSVEPQQTPLWVQGGLRRLESLALCLFQDSQLLLPSCPPYMRHYDIEGNNC